MKKARDPERFKREFEQKRQQHFKKAEAVLLKRADAGDPVSQLVRDLWGHTVDKNSGNKWVAEELLKSLLDKFGSDLERRHQLLGAVLDNSAKFPDWQVQEDFFRKHPNFQVEDQNETSLYLEGMLPNLASIFPTPDDIEFMLDERRELLTAFHSPLFGLFCTDPYWLRTVRYYIQKKDWRRAWDELKRAGRGYSISDKRGTSEEFVKLENRCCYAQTEAFRTLIRELFFAQGGKGSCLNHGSYDNPHGTHSYPDRGVSIQFIEGKAVIEFTEQIPELRYLQRLLLRGVEITAKPFAMPYIFHREAAYFVVMSWGYNDYRNSERKQKRLEQLRSSHHWPMGEAAVALVTK